MEGLFAGLDVSTQSCKIVVIDLGAQYAQLIARRVREAHVFSEIVPKTITAAELRALQPFGIILSGGNVDLGKLLWASI